jgi:hypothetical protein
MNITINKDSYNFEINDHKLNKYENIESYKYTLCVSELKLLINNNNNNNSNKDYYFIFDCPGETAFQHWIQESFIYYPMLTELLNIYPNIKIVTYNTKKYVKAFFNFFNIKNEIVNTINNTNNICFFPPVTSLNDQNINKEIWLKYLNNYCSYINNNINNLNINNIILLPRNKKDNYVNNDRKIHGIENLEDKIIEVGGTSLDTYAINNIGLQFSIINSFNTIILDMGSSFFVNCLHLKNKKILLIDPTCLRDYVCKHYITQNILYNIIKMNNTIHIISTDYNTFKHLL